VQPAELLRELLDLAREAGLVVRSMPRAAGRDGDLPPASGLCRVRDDHWILLASGDPIERRIDVLAEGLRRCRGEFLEQRYLAPALRERLGTDPADASGAG
jgi:hypothetical protein